MKRRVSPELPLCAAVCAGLLVLAIAAAQPGLVAVAAPFAIVIGLGLAGSGGPPPVVLGSVLLERDLLNEGEQVAMTLELRSAGATRRVELAIALPPELVLVEGQLSKVVRLDPSAATEVRAVIEARRWGSFELGPIALRFREPGGLVSWEGSIGVPSRLEVRPAGEPVRRLVRPRTVGSATGEQTSVGRGEGVEFTDIRGWVPGDPARLVNWRVTARRGVPHVNQYQPERNVDVVLFIDTFAVAGLADSIRVAWALAETYLARHDRVGVIGFGGVMSWIEPAGGARQRERIADALVGTDSYVSFAWKTIDALPARTLPARCLVLAISPLVDERSRSAIAAMRARGLDVGVIEIPVTDDPPPDATWAHGAALRLLAMQRQMIRERFLAHGVAIVTWDATTGVQTALSEMDRYRRRARTGSAR